jgi:hypothetical protein
VRKLLLDVNLTLFKIDAAPFEPGQFTDSQARVSLSLNQDACRLIRMTRQGRNFRGRKGTHFYPEFGLSDLSARIGGYPIETARVLAQKAQHQESVVNGARPNVAREHLLMPLRDFLCSDRR